MTVAELRLLEFMLGGLLTYRGMVSGGLSANDKRTAFLFVVVGFLLIAHSVFIVGMAL